MTDRIGEALSEAIETEDEVRISTLRLMLACLKDREAAIRADEGAEDTLSTIDAAAILAQMVRQRAESAAGYEEQFQMELAERERIEARIIGEFLPRQLGEDEIGAAVAEAIGETGANSIRDMGKVMAVLKARYTGQMDFAAASARVKAALA